MHTDTQLLNTQMTIEGLKWIDRWRIGNGRADSYVVPFPTTRPINIVTHGEEQFEYGQYGIHLAQQDVLTFLGNVNARIRARFIDCRMTSPTFRRSVDIYFAPTSGRTLIIPPGVAHTFSGLEGVVTLNAYCLFLPPLEAVVQPIVGWRPEHDIINLPLDTEPKSVEGVTAMSEPASDRVYYQLAELQTATLSARDVTHGETRSFVLNSGENVRLMLQQTPNPLRATANWPTSQIGGVKFERRAAVQTGEHSRIIPVAGPSPLYIVDHGTQPYSFDSFGIHLGQEDHLTFFGSSEHVIRLHLVDMREGSATLHREEWHTFSPDPEMQLVIPCGVAHALSDMEHVFTLNRPALYLDEHNAYQPGNDVIDWPISDRAYPVLRPNEKPASLPYLQALAKLQKQTMAAAAVVQTPKAVLVNDEATGKQVKVILSQTAAVAKPAP